MMDLMAQPSNKHAPGLGCMSAAYPQDRNCAHVASSLRSTARFPQCPPSNTALKRTAYRRRLPLR